MLHCAREFNEIRECRLRFPFRIGAMEYVVFGIEGGVSFGDFVYS